MGWLLPALIAGLLIPTIPAFAVQVPGADFTLECDQTKGVLTNHRTFAECTVTGLNGYDGRITIACDTDVPRISCHPTWHPYVSPDKPVQTIALHNGGYVIRPDNGTIGTWTVTGTSADGKISHQATTQEPFQTMFVIPEFPIGGIAVVLSSLGALGLYLKTRPRRNS
jgi:hypothetical protein